MRQDWIRCGVRCEACDRDQWYPLQGFNRCGCGQELWVERVTDEMRGTHFPYAQGAQVRPGYPGWITATR